MTEPPRPPGDNNGGTPFDPTAAPPPPSYPPSPSYPPPGETPAPSYPPPASGDAPPPTSGGGFPPPGNYPPPGAYPPPGGQPQGGPGYPPPGAGFPAGPGQPGGGYGPPVGYPTSDDKTWALLAHFGGILVGFVAPLIAYLAKGSQSPTVRAHSVEALNFQITWGIAMIIGVILTVCSLGALIFVPTIVWVVVLVFSILGGLKANEGHVYRYPMTFRFIN